MPEGAAIDHILIVPTSDQHRKDEPEGDKSSGCIRGRSQTMRRRTWEVILDEGTQHRRSKKKKKKRILHHSAPGSCFRRSHLSPSRFEITPIVVESIGSTGRERTAGNLSPTWTMHARTRTMPHGTEPAIYHPPCPCSPL